MSSGAFAADLSRTDFSGLQGPKLDMCLAILGDEHAFTRAHDLFQDGIAELGSESICQRNSVARGSYAEGVVSA